MTYSGRIGKLKKKKKKDDRMKGRTEKSYFLLRTGRPFFVLLRHLFVCGGGVFCVVFIDNLYRVLECWLAGRKGVQKLIVSEQSNGELWLIIGGIIIKGKGEIAKCKGEVKR